MKLKKCVGGGKRAARAPGITAAFGQRLCEPRQAAKMASCPRILAAGSQQVAAAHRPARRSSKRRLPALPFTLLQRNPLISRICPHKHFSHATNHPVRPGNLKLAPNPAEPASTRLNPAGYPDKPTYKPLSHKVRTGCSRIIPDKTTSVFFHNLKLGCVRATTVDLLPQVLDLQLVDAVSRRFSPKTTPISRPEVLVFPPVPHFPA